MPMKTVALINQTRLSQSKTLDSEVIMDTVLDGSSQQSVEVCAVRILIRRSSFLFLEILRTLRR